MANIKKKRHENEEGNYYVDSSCIDCGTCYWISPSVFKNIEGLAAVIKQPDDPEVSETTRALLSCPVNAIGVIQKDESYKRSLDSFPYLINDNVFHTGYHSEKSYGATSYFIRAGEGNILIDSPRFLKKLESKFKEFGGIKYQLLTHRDDIADTDRYWDTFQGTRYIHKDDVSQKTQHYEVKFEGNEPIQLRDDLVVIPVPGHTHGSVCYLYKNKYLFTGDHLAFSRKLNHLYAFKTACWYDFSTQIKSMERLLEYNFEYVLPGHGSPYASNPKEMKSSLLKCIEWMKF